MLQPWRFCAPLEGDVNLVRDLSRDLVERQGRDQAKHALRDTEGYRNEVGVAEGGEAP